MVRKGGNPVASLLAMVLLAAALFGLAALIGWAGIADRQLALVALCSVLGASIVVGIGFYLLFQGFRATYACSYGVIWSHNGRLEWAGFSDIDLLVVNKPREKVRAAELITFDGRTAPITAAPHKGADRFIEHLAHEVRRMGRPVTNPQSWARRRFGGHRRLNIARRPLQRWLGLLGIIGSVLLAYAADRAMAIPAWLGLPAAVLAVGLVITMLGSLLDTRITAAGYALLIMGSLLCVGSTVIRLPQYNSILVGTTVLALQALVVTAWRALYLRLPAHRPTRARKRLAARSGWTFHPRTTVVVPGPRTALRLLGIPTNLNQTTGYDVLHAPIGQTSITVYDRYRRRPRLGEPVQTVWAVDLPSPLPYSIGEAVAGHADTESPATAPNLFVAALRNTLGERDIPVTINGRAWWVEGAFLYSTGHHVSTRSLVRHAEQLVELATTLGLWSDVDV